MIRWLMYLVLYLVVWLIKWPVSPVAVIFFSTPSRLYLTWPFKWLETIDNDLTGDTGWKAEHLAGHDPRSTWNRIRWMWRNGGNALNYGLLGCDYLEATTIYWDHYMWTREDGYWFCHRWVRISNSKLIELQFGWNLLGPQEGRCKFVFTMRLVTKK